VSITGTAFGGKSCYRQALLVLLVFTAGGVVGVVVWPLLERTPPRRLEATIYFPVQDNEGKRFTPEVWDGALNILIEEFEGATLGQQVTGCWRNQAGQIQREPIQLVIVSLERRQLPQLQAALHRIAKLLGQEAIYVRYEEPRIELIR
jgi:hypothetical protein